MSKPSEQATGGASEQPFRYTAALAQEIESRWQATWEREQTFHSPGPLEDGFDPSKPKKLILDMFPYPSGVGLHVGHPLGYIATDIYARYLRMTGNNVLHPMGYDAFGLPAEQFAIRTGQHPRITTEANIVTMKAQMRRLGLGHDPQRSLATTDVEFYRWTQWIFLQIFNAWYDKAEDRARPITALIEELEAGKRQPSDEVHNPKGLAWKGLTDLERRKIVDSYRLAYLAEVPVNWCPALGTVLANEEVTAEGRSERGNHPVLKRPLKQWMMRITAYTERLLRDLGPLDWPEPIKIMQRNWIGRSEGADVDFLALAAPGTDGKDSGKKWLERRRQDGWSAGKPREDLVIRVFTTRPDTLYGATYMVLAPEHPLVDRLTSEEWPDATPSAWRGDFPGHAGKDASPRKLVAAYRKYAEGKSDVERQVESREKTGVFIGAYALNPVNNEEIPIFVADYVLMGYGTGAIMAVPAHDERDFQFARQTHLPVRVVVRPAEEREPADVPEEAFTAGGISVHSQVIDGLPTPEAKKTLTRWLEERGLGKGAVNYRLRDWLFSRQRYWGEPFPIVYDETEMPVPLEESELPVELPEVDDYAPEITDDPDTPPRPPLARAKDWVKCSRDGRTYRRELNTMPNWAGSCWYYLRYLDPHNSEKLVDLRTERYWNLTQKEGPQRPEAYDPKSCKIGGVDLYVGGAEHAVLHLLYARFWHKALYDLGDVSTPEPFQRLFNQGYVQAAAYTDERGVYVEAAEIEERDGQFFHQGKPVKREFGKMGKSLRNAISPDEIAEEYGADTLRLYEMFMGPLEMSKHWNTRDIIGVHRFLQRVWRNLVDEQTGHLCISEEGPDEELARTVHKTIDSVRRDMETLGFNTAIARLQELNNTLTALDRVPRSVTEVLIRMLAPLAPHIAEELWSKLGHETSIAYEPFPEADPKFLVEDRVEIPVMIGGKVRAKIQVAPGTSPAGLEETALAHPKVGEFLAGKNVVKVIAVPDRMVNIVVK